MKHNDGKDKNGPTLQGEKREARKVPPVKKSTMFSWVTKQKPKTKQSFGKTLLKACAIMCIWGMCFSGLALLWFSYDLPDIDRLQQTIRKPSVTIQTQEGQILATYGDFYEDMVALKELPPYVYQAVIAIEDRRFYSHFGVDIISLFRAAYTNYQADRIVQGGSTITQQLAKNFLQTQGLCDINDKSLRRKIQEVLLSLWLEWHFEKDQILTIYLNRVYLGANAFGIDAAAHKYFNCSARQLNVYQSAVIAGLLKAPSTYSPLNHPDKAFERAKIVLQQMNDAGFIQNYEQYLDQAKAELQETAEQNQGDVRYFTDWINENITNFVPLDQDLVVITTLDPAMQKHAEKVCKEMNETLGKELNASQIGFVVMTPTGAVKAMVGGVDYRKKQYNHVTQAERQPGSAFKSFVYLAALESGMTPETMIEDTLVQVGNWHPGNYKYEAQGEVSLLEGMAKSVNAVVVRLGLAVGAPKIIEVARRLGITSKMTPDLSITLGSMETTLLQLTASFATYANKGYAVWPHGILEIRSKDGTVLYKPDNGQPLQVIQPEHLLGMRQMLNAVVTQGTGRAAALAAGGKTGSNQDKDAWFIGYTDSLVAGVWVGNDDNKPMKKISVGGRMPARTWQAFFSGLKDVNYTKSANDLDSILDTVVMPTENLPTGQLKAPEEARKERSEPTEKELAFDNIEDMINAFASSDAQ